MIKPDTSIVSARYLSHDERVVIADLHRAGLNSRAIAEQVGRTPSTVSRELARNSAPDGRYGAASAQQRAAGRRRRPRARRLEVDPVLRGFVQQCMDVRWSPEQISHALTVEFPDDPTRQLVPESLYQALYAAVPVLKAHVPDPPLASTAAPAPRFGRPLELPARHPNGDDRSAACGGRRPRRGRPLPVGSWAFGLVTTILVNVGINARTAGWVAEQEPERWRDSAATLGDLKPSARGRSWSPSCWSRPALRARSLARVDQHRASC